MSYLHRLFAFTVQLERLEQEALLPKRERRGGNPVVCVKPNICVCSLPLTALPLFFSSSHTTCRKANSLRTAAFSCYSNKPPALARGRWRCTRVVCFYLPSGVRQQRLRKWVLQSTGALVKAAKKPREKAECSELETHDFTRDTQRSTTATIPQNVANLKQHS